MISVIELVLSLLGTTLTQLKNTGAEQSIVAGIQAAIENLQKVQGTPVTFSQLESLKIKPEW